MENIMQVLEEAMCERLKLAYYELIKENDEVRENIEAVKELGTKLYKIKIFQRK